MPSDAERARALVEAWERHLVCSTAPDGTDRLTWHSEATLVDAISGAFAAVRAAAKAKGRAEMREEAARIAEEWLGIYGTARLHYVSAQEYACGAVSDILVAIRALPASPAPASEETQG